VAEKKMTNIRLDPALWARVKAAAGQQGTTLERWVTLALEAHLQQGHGPSVPHEAGAAADGAGRPVPADAIQALHWRVEALEQAVDYLAGVAGAGLAPGGERERPGPAGPDESAGRTAEGGAHRA
jgi:hypothetical protein